MGAYLFAAAAVLAVLGILFVFKRNVDILKKDPDLITKVNNKLFIGVAISEAIPIVLIIIGFVTMETVSNISELMVPGVIIIMTMVFAIIFILLQTRIDVDEKSKSTVNSFGMITIALANAIPLISVAGLFMMMPS